MSPNRTRSRRQIEAVQQIKAMTDDKPFKIEPTFAADIYNASKRKRKTIFQKSNGENDNKRSHVIGHLNLQRSKSINTALHKLMKIVDNSIMKPEGAFLFSKAGMLLISSIDNFGRILIHHSGHDR